MEQTIKITCTAQDHMAISELARFQGQLKTIAPEELEKLKQSIITYGFSFPIFIWQHNILDGHQRLKAIEALISDGYEVPDLPVVHIHAADDREAAEKLLLINSRYAQISQDGFDDFIHNFEVDLSKIGSLLNIPEIGIFEEELNLVGDTEPEISDDPKTKIGDLWQLDKHRLLCGDSTNEEDVMRLMNGEKAILMQTDPPYGISHISTKDKIPRKGFSNMSDIWENIKNDDLKDEKLQSFLEKAFKIAADIALKKNAAWYLWHAHLTQGFFAAAAAAAAANVILHRQIIWIKPGFVITRSGMYHWKHEPCFYGWIKGNMPNWYGNKSQSTVWQIDRDRDAIHPTQKPVQLWINGIDNHTRKNDILYEPFCGSGSQIIAAQIKGRICYAMELSPVYVDAAVERWENLTGQKAVLTNR